MSSIYHDIKWEYYDITNELYYSILRRKHHDVRCKVEILDHNENALDSIEADIDGNDSGSIVANNGQGTRRSCSLTLINVDKKYTLTENNFFWFNRKFRLYKGITDGDSIFWFTQGVFITQSASMDSTNKTVSIQGVDKYAQLDGTLNVLQADQFDTVFEVGSTINNVVRDILMLDIGNGRPLDPIEPIIDEDIANQRIYKEYTMSAGSYYGDFLSELMTSFGCDIYYDAFGRLRVTRVFNDDVAYWYAFKGSNYDFSYDSVNYQNAQLSGQLNGVNKVIVQTDNTETKNASYTAINNNPQSPLCYDKIGARTYAQNGGIIYITSGDEDIDTPMTKCKDYAEYFLMKETMYDLSIDFNCPCLPHLKEGDVISISDEDFDLDLDYFLISSITQPLNAGEMSISAVNLKFLPTDIYNDSIASTMINAEHLNEIKIYYDLNGGTGVTPETQTVNYYESFIPQFTTNASEAYQMSNKEFIGWDIKKNSSTAKYTSSSSGYSCPYEDTTLYAIYDDALDYQFKVIISGTENLSYHSFSTIPCFDSPAVEYVVGDSQKHYVRQANPDSSSVNLPSIQVPESGEFTYTHGSSKSFWSLLDMDRMIAQLNHYVLNLADGNDARTKVICPEALSSIQISNDFFYNTKINELQLPNGELRFINNSTDIKNVLNNISGLTDLVFNDKLELFRYSGISSCGDLKTLTFKDDVIISNDNPNIKVINENNALETLTFGKQTIFGNGNYVIHNPLLKSVEFNDKITAKSTYGQYCYLLYTSTSTMRSYFDDFKINECYFSGNVRSIVSNDFNCPLVLNGDITIVSNEDSDKYQISYPTFIVSNNFNASEPIVFKGVIESEGGNIFNGNTFTTGNGEIVFEKNVNLKAGNSSVYFTGNAGLKTVRFYGDVSLETSSFNGNTSLTDVYFYTDNIQYNNAVFRGANGNLTIHGITDDGNARALANMLGVSFELIEEGV